MIPGYQPSPSLTEALKQADWPETELYLVPGSRLIKSPFRADQRYHNICDRSVERLVQGGFSHVFILLAFRRLHFGQPCVLRRRDRDSIARYFLHWNGKYLGVDGWQMTAEALKVESGCDLIECDWERIVRDIRRIGMEEREWVILKQRMGDYVGAKANQWADWDLQHRDHRPYPPRLPVGANDSTVLRAIAEKWFGRKLVLEDGLTMQAT